MKNRIIALILFAVIFMGLLPAGAYAEAEASAEEYINVQGAFAAQNTEINVYIVPSEYAGAAIESAELSSVSLYHTTASVDGDGKYNIRIPQKYDGENYVYITCQNQSALKHLEDYKTHGISEIHVTENNITVSGIAKSKTGHAALFVLKKGKSYKDLANGDLTAVKSINSASIENGGYTAIINDCTIDEGDMLLVSFGDEFAVSEITNFSGSIDYYVSEYGNDDNSGNKLSPLKSIEKARELIWSINKNVTKVNVYINEGEYEISNVTFEKKDSGSDAYPVTYQGIGTKKPVFKNTKKIDTSLFEGLSQEETAMIRQDAKAKVQKADLSAQGFTANDFKFDSKSGQEIYFNGTEQELAGWPNNGYVLIDDVSVPQTDIQNCVFNFYNKELKRWTNAKYPIIEGYMGVEYEKQRVNAGKINSDDFSVSFAEHSDYGAKKGYRFRITNLLEELDMPGEYYLDKDTLVLYYYPYDSFKEGDVLEVSLPSSSALTLENVSNMKISDISITQNNADGITFNNCSKLVIENCYIGKLGGNGIKGSGTSIDMNRNTIGNVGNIGIELEYGGDRNKLTENNVKIRNNHIYLTGKLGIYIGTNTVGTNIINNVIHKTGQYPIRFGGNKNYIAYNEVYNANRELGDSCAIYSGRNLSEYGNKISYNYVHHMTSLDKRIYSSNGLITGDDWESGTILNNNIVFMDSKINNSAFGTHSRDNTIQYNIAVGAEKGISLTDRYIWVGSMFEKDDIAINSLLKTLNVSAGLKNGYAETEIWKKEYPQISAIYQDLVDNNGRFITRNNIITDNVLVDAPFEYYDTHPSSDHSEMYRKYSTVENNFETDNYDIFVDSKNHDFRITNEAMAANNLNENIINESNFDMEAIGILGDIETFDKDFLLTYPQNGSVLEAESEMALRWQDTGFADSYTYQVAEDEKFDNIIAEDTVYENHAKINVKKNQKYYWRVLAHNTSKEFGSSQYNIGGVYSFSVKDMSVTVENVRIADDAKSVDVYFTNNEAQNLNCRVIWASYDESGRLKKAEIFNDTIEAGEVNGLHSYSLAGSEFETYSVFVWSENQIPLAKPYTEKILNSVEANTVTLTTKDSKYSEISGLWTNGSIENQRIGKAQNGEVSASFEFNVDSPGYYNVYYKVDTLNDGAENASVYALNGGGSVSGTETINTAVNFKEQSGYVYVGKTIAIDINGNGYLKIGITADSGSISVSEVILEEVIE